jgi:hypothetical protein
MENRQRERVREWIANRGWLRKSGGKVDGAVVCLATAEKAEVGIILAQGGKVGT